MTMHRFSCFWHKGWLCGSTKVENKSDRMIKEDNVLINEDIGGTWILEK